jgi:uncharacterized protein with GYD domain
MAKYVNFYETVKEANMRLQHTVILYDGDPYYVLCVTDHKADGIFRIYMDKLGHHPQGLAMARISGIPYEMPESATTTNGSDYIYHKKKGEAMDKWLDDNPDAGIIRKMMNSPAFNKFRPFDVGMMNTGRGCIYAQRAPVRHTQQGLTSAMLLCRPVDLSEDETPMKSSRSVEITSSYFLDCIKGVYPSADQCIKELKDKKTAVRAAAFHRNFAIVKGPVSSMFLTYKEDVIGIIAGPDASSAQVLLGAEHKHCKEVVEALNVFESVVA